MNIKKQAVNDARQLLSVAWAGRGIPVDPVTIANTLGLDVLTANMPDNMSGALIKAKGHDPAIFVNRIDAPNRQRFTCAHELGHYVYRLNDDNYTDDYEYVDLRAELASAGTRIEEIYANTFAAELLMPEEAVRQMVSKNIPRSIISVNLQVSDDAIRIRMSNLGL